MITLPMAAFIIITILAGLGLGSIARVIDIIIGRR